MASPLDSTKQSSSLGSFMKSFKSAPADKEPESDDDDTEQEANEEPANADALLEELKAVLEADPAPEGGGGAAASATDTAPPLGEFCLRCVLRARKFDVARAAKVARKLRAWRHEMQACDLSPVTHPKLERGLRTGKVRLTGGRDLQGRAILVLQLRSHDPSEYTALDMLQLVFYVIEQVSCRA